jgi:hypothetical protein
MKPARMMDRGGQHGANVTKAARYSASVSLALANRLQRAEDEVESLVGPSKAAERVSYAAWANTIERMMMAAEKAEGRPHATYLALMEDQGVRAFLRHTLGPETGMSPETVAAGFSTPEFCAYLRDFETVSVAAAAKEGMRKLSMVAADIILRDRRLGNNLTLRAILQKQVVDGTPEDKRLEKALLALDGEMPDPGPDEEEDHGRFGEDDFDR